MLNVVATLEHRPMMLNAKLIVARLENSRLKEGTYPISVRSRSSSSELVVTECVSTSARGGACSVFMSAGEDEDMVVKDQEEVPSGTR